MSADGDGVPVFGRTPQTEGVHGARPDGWVGRTGAAPYPVEAPTAKPPPHPAPVQPAAKEEPEPEFSEEKLLDLLYPKEYEAVRTVRAHEEPSVLFVPKAGMPFSYPNSYCSGVRPLPDGEGISVSYPGEVVEIRGDKLLKVFFELSGHRAHIVREWRSDWAKRPQDRAVIKSITVKAIDPPADLGMEGEGA